MLSWMEQQVIIEVTEVDSRSLNNGRFALGHYF